MAPSHQARAAAKAGSARRRPPSPGTITKRGAANPALALGKPSNGHTNGHANGKAPRDLIPLDGDADFADF